MRVRVCARNFHHGTSTCIDMHTITGSFADGKLKVSTRFPCLACDVPIPKCSVCAFSWLRMLQIDAGKIYHSVCSVGSQLEALDTCIDQHCIKLYLTLTAHEIRSSLFSSARFCCLPAALLYVHGSQVGDRIDRVNGKDVGDGEDCVVKVELNCLITRSAPEQPCLLFVRCLPCSVSEGLWLVGVLSPRAWPGVCLQELKLCRDSIGAQLQISYTRGQQQFETGICVCPISSVSAFICMHDRTRECSSCLSRARALFLLLLRMHGLRTPVTSCLSFRAAMHR